LVFHYHPDKAVKIDVGIDYVSFGRHNKGPKDDILKKKEKEKKQHGYQLWLSVLRIQSSNDFHRLENEKSVILV
jgi:hypothetical protein